MFWRNLIGKLYDAISEKTISDSYTEHKSNAHVHNIHNSAPRGDFQESS